MQDGLRDLLKNGDGFVVSANIWTSRTGQSFLGIMVSFIDGTFQGHTLFDELRQHKGTTTIPQIAFTTCTKVF